MQSLCINFIKFKTTTNHSFVKKTKFLFLILFFFISIHTYADKYEADSIYHSLQRKMDDTLRVKALRDLSVSMYTYSPDSALQFAYEALFLAKKIKYKRGISNSKEIIAVILTRMGNYNKALNYYIDNLKLEESMKSDDGIICAKINIGIVYTYLLDYNKALENYLLADSLVNTFHTNDKEYKENLRYSIKLNIGDVYGKMKKVDSAYIYFNQSLNIAIQEKQSYNQGVSMLGLASVYASLKKYDLSLVNYKVSFENLKLANDEDLMCEALLGIAKVFVNIQKPDSAMKYARYGMYLAKKDNFLSRQFDISSFMAKYFAKQHNSDSAYFYLNQSIVLKDSLMGIEKMRHVEQTSFNENLRQEELVEKAIEEKEIRRQQLQHIFIGIFIPLLFIFTMILTKMKIRVGVIRFLGVISLLFLFEYLTLLLHPIVEKITHHSPALEILIFVCIASLLIPTHHKIEHKLIDMLLRRTEINNLKIKDKIDKAKKALENKIKK